MQTPGQKTHKTVIDYIASLRWDCTPRIHSWLIDCAGAKNSPHVHNASRGMLIDAVRRARRPGCQIDRVPILVGPQGSGKTKALRVLAVEENWFSTDFAFHGGANRLMETTADKWICEWAVEVKDFNDPALLKIYLSRAYEAYFRERARVPRQFVIVGTLAQGNIIFPDAQIAGYLLPVLIKHFDLDRLRAMRDQLWAEAAAREAAESPTAAASIVSSRHLTVELDGNCAVGDVVTLIGRIRGVVSVKDRP